MGGSEMSSNSLGNKKSSYLVDQIAARPNIEVRCETTVQKVHGDDHLESVTIRNSGTGVTDELPASGDVRSRSIKRVASAVGEGAVAVQFVHQLLQG